jgi:pimeloyl-ACP methyl ester carboxylesterase
LYREAAAKLTAESRYWSGRTILNSSQERRRVIILTELDPQVGTHPEQFQANAAQHPVAAASPSANETIVATRQRKKHTFVLVHGAWFGAWVWRDVASGLREMGHVVTTPTLTGVGERRHLGDGATDLSTHIEDVAIHVEMEDLQDIVLVGWSYAGLVIAGVLPRIEHRIKSMIYLDAFLPEDGKAVIDSYTGDRRAGIEVHRRDNTSVPPLPLAYLGVTEQLLIDFITPRLAPQPWRTFFEPFKEITRSREVPTGYIRCTLHKHEPFDIALERMKADPRVRTATIQTGHTGVLTDPNETINALISFA